MSMSWLKNFAGLKLEDKDLRDIPSPYIELNAHIILKCVQAFGLLGTFVIGPVSALLFPETRTISAVVESAITCGKWGVAIGCGAGPLMTYGRLRSVGASRDAVVDRCYRLRMNHTQLRVDRGSLLGAGVGAATTMMTSGVPTPGALVGMSAGVIMMALYSATRPKPKKS